MSIVVSEIRTAADFHDLHDEWNALLSQSTCDVPFLTHEWIETWSDHLAAPGTRTTIIARDDGRLVFALPLVERRLGGGPLSLRLLHSATNSHSFRFQLLMEQDRIDVLQYVMEYLQRRKAWHLLLLDYVPVDDQASRHLLEQALRAGLTGHVKPMYDSAELMIEGTWNEHLSGLKKSFKKTMRRQERRLQEIGEVRVETLQTEREVLDALPEALDIERRSWKGDRGSAIACQPALAQFYTSLAQTTAQRGWMRLSFLNVGGERTAFEFALEYNRKFYSIKIGYDPDKYGVYSVGRRLVHESIARCFDNELQAYDFVGAYSPAQEHWAPTRHPVGWIYVYNKHVYSRLHCGWEFALKPQVKRLLAPIRNRKSTSRSTDE